MTIARLFADLSARGEMAFAPYFVAGWPTLDRSLELIATAAAAGADLVEIGVPFSDPVADGATIQRASHAALQAGFRLSSLLDALRAAPLRRPGVLMSYLNPLLAVGRDRLLTALAAAQVRGLIVPDLPFEESADWLGAARAAGVALIYLVAPTTAPERIARMAEQTDGFLYAVSLTGTTGVRRELNPGLFDYLARVRGVARCPVAVGFGISTPQQVAALRGRADGVIVGSRWVEAVERGEDVAGLLHAFKQSTRSENHARGHER
ncbi:MAG: tryptophan synthase subunit alpha [Phycisphaerae bacterium]